MSRKKQPVWRKFAPAKLQRQRKNAYWVRVVGPNKLHLSAALSRAIASDLVDVYVSPTKIKLTPGNTYRVLRYEDSQTHLIGATALIAQEGLDDGMRIVRRCADGWTFPRDPS
jgi:hypothetical protein